MRRCAMCPVCGRRMRRFLNACGIRDGETDCCDPCSSTGMEEDAEEGLRV